MEFCNYLFAQPSKINGKLFIGLEIDLESSPVATAGMRYWLSLPFSHSALFCKLKFGNSVTRILSSIVLHLFTKLPFSFHVDSSSEFLYDTTLEIWGHHVFCGIITRELLLHGITEPIQNRYRSNRFPGPRKAYSHFFRNFLTNKCTPWR